MKSIQGGPGFFGSRARIPAHKPRALILDMMVCSFLLFQVREILGDYNATVSNPFANHTDKYQLFTGDSCLNYVFPTEAVKACGAELVKSSETLPKVTTMYLPKTDETNTYILALSDQWNATLMKCLSDVVIEQITQCEAQNTYTDLSVMGSVFGAPGSAAIIFPFMIWLSGCHFGRCQWTKPNLTQLSALFGAMTGFGVFVWLSAAVIQPAIHASDYRVSDESASWSAAAIALFGGLCASTVIGAGLFKLLYVLSVKSAEKGSLIWDDAVARMRTDNGNQGTEMAPV